MNNEATVLTLKPGYQTLKADYDREGSPFQQTFLVRVVFFLPSQEAVAEIVALLQESDPSLATRLDIIAPAQEEAGFPLVLSMRSNDGAEEVAATTVSSYLHENAIFLSGLRGALQIVLQAGKITVQQLESESLETYAQPTLRQRAASFVESYLERLGSIYQDLPPNYFPPHL